MIDLSSRLSQIEHPYARHYGGDIDLLRLRQAVGLFGWREYVALARESRRIRRAHAFIDGQRQPITCGRGTRVA